MAALEYNPTYLLTSLNRAFAAGQASFFRALESHFSVYVPRIYGLQPLDAATQKKLAQRCLFEPLEQFLCQSADTETVFSELKARDGAPRLCGKAFRNGEPTYSCRDCALDPTCVFCMECFDRSIHKKHKYRINTSGGGGYCDCGDVEAWNSHPSCDIHKQADSSDDLSRPGELDLDQPAAISMPDGMQERYEALLRKVMDYTYSMLSWQNGLELPESLQRAEADVEPLTYVTMLFNDEVHTYEQVIQTLEKAVNCSHKEAIEFATTVDREGRSPVLRGEQENCARVANLIVKKTRIGGTGKPLKVEVMSSSVVAHQLFAQDMLGWLQSLIKKSNAIRLLFCKVSMQQDSSDEGGELSVLEKMLLNDTNFWKVVRQQSHDLFMAGVFTDMYYKCEFAKLFTKHYGRIYHDFSRDDHYRTVSVTSVTVQIYTVTTIAKVLIEKHQLIEIIMQTLLEETKHKVDGHGQFEFSRHQSDFLELKRVQYAFSDLRYALSSALPSLTWNDRLRAAFLKGLAAFLSFLARMQAMDSVTRQTKSHIEYEPEWETAFNIHIKMEDCITLLLEWCRSDKEVLQRACESVLTLVGRTGVANLSRRLVTVGSHQAYCVCHSVASDPVSIHLPLTRFLAGLCVHLQQHNLQLNSLWTDLNDAMDVVAFMECPLQVQVLMAQAHAVMWKRNGISLISQLHYYHNIRFRREMYDKDILALQIAAAMMDNNQFLIHLLSKFDLLRWLEESYEAPGTGDLVSQTITLTEEFLSLLIVIIGERYVEGIGRVTKDDIVKYEIVHQLALGQLTRSDLEQNLPDHLSTEVGIEENIRQVAIFQKKGELGKGMYELRPEKRKDINPNYYHYCKAEQSKAEENHQKSSKSSPDSPPPGSCSPPSGGCALPMPVPPPFSTSFSQVAGLLHCDVMMHIMRTVLKRIVAPRSRSRSDAQCEKVLHLIALALHEDMHRQDDSGNGPFTFFVRAKTGGAESVAVLLASAAHAGHVTQEPTKLLLQWTLDYMRTVEQCMSGGISEPMAVQTSTDGPDAASSSTDPNTRLQQEKRQRTEKASKSKQKMIDKMARLQKKFLKENLALLESAPLAGPSASMQDMDTSENNIIPHSEKPGFPASVAVFGSHTTASPAVESYTCIVCQEESIVTSDSKAFIYLAYVQRSSVLSQHRPSTSKLSSGWKQGFMPSDLPVGTFVSTCGHTMHSDCRQRYFDSSSARERRLRLQLRFQRHVADHEVDEFLCPLCGTIGNTVIPVIPPLTFLKPASDQLDVLVDFGDWLEATAKIAAVSIQDYSTEQEDTNEKPCPLPELAQALADSAYAKLTEFYRLMNASGEERGIVAGEVLQVMQKFGDDVKACDPESKARNISAHTAMWNACAFTVQVLEQVLRFEGKPLFGDGLSTRQQSCLTAIVRCSAVAQQATLAAVVRQRAIQIVSGLLGIAHPTPGQPGSSGNNAMPAECDLLSLDLWHYFVAACLSLSSLYLDKLQSGTNVFASTSYSAGGMAELHLLRLVLVAHIVQAMVSTGSLEPACEAEGTTEGSCDRSLLDVADQIYELASIQPPYSRSDSSAAQRLEQRLKHACLPFLRCAALFFSALTDVNPVPGCLYNDYDSVCSYLGLPTRVFQLFAYNQVEIMELVKKWFITAASVRNQSITSVAPIVISYPLTAKPLIHLPADYSELINKASTFTCKKSCGADDSRSPTMCLVCGEMVCSQSYCCQVVLEGSQQAVGAATAHAQTCSNGTCMFLRVRQCQVLMLTGQTKGCLSIAPYVDEYGETDQGLRRGMPLYLCETEYKKLYRWWLHHSIPEVVSHNIETRHTGLDWQHL